MGQTPEDIRNEIEQTREQMGETVEAIGNRANVPARAKGWASDKKDAVVGTVTGTADSVVSAVSGTKDSVTSTVPDGQQVKQTGRRVKGLAEQNPIGLAIAGAAVGFVAGLFAPATRAENERLGPVSDQLKSAATEAGQEAIQHGKEVAQAAAQSAAETAKEQGREHGEELSSSLHEKARDVAPTA
jgi:gas vesicle protein